MVERDSEDHQSTEEDNMEMFGQSVSILQQNTCHNYRVWSMGKKKQNYTVKNK